MTYDVIMPRLWSATIHEHRSAVLNAILDATGEVVGESGITGVSMTAIAATAGVGRATLYKYVPDTAAAIAAWQHREVEKHLAELRAIAVQAPPASRLGEMLEAYAVIRHGRHGQHGGSAAHGLHAPDRIHPVEGEVRELVASVIEEDVIAGRARTDISATHLAAYAVAAIGAAAVLPDEGTARRIGSLVADTIETRAGSSPRPLPGDR